MPHAQDTRVDFLTIRLIHTGLLADGRPNTRSVQVSDVDFGEVQQNRKMPVYIPVGGSVEIPFSDKVFFSYKQGSIRGFIDDGVLSVIIPAEQLGESTLSWGFETAVAGIDYVGGFYDFAGTDDNFSPSVTFGTANASKAAHVFVVTGAVPVDEVTITVTGASIDDDGVRMAGDTDTIVIPAGTPMNTYFEVKKFNGEVDIETTGGTPIACNYGWSKYYDNNNREFNVLGMETVWTAANNEASGSNIRLLHHRAAGWTFNSGSTPTPPSALASRSTDHGPDVAHVDGEQGAWKRANLVTHIAGSMAEGVMWEITSASAGIGSQSFRTLNCQLLIQTCPLGCD